MGINAAEMKVLLIAVLIASATALPLANEEAQLVPDGDDQKTAEAEVNAAIEHNIDMSNLSGAKGLGEVLKGDGGKSSWAKDTLASINKMSVSEMKAVVPTGEDKNVKQFEADAKAAKAVMAKANKMEAGKKKVSKKKHEKKMSAAQMKKLKAAGEQAEMNLASPVLPVSLLETDFNDIGEDETDMAGMHLEGGSDAEVQKEINAAIGQQAAQQLGESKVDPAMESNLKKFEQDKVEASRLVETNPVSAKEVARSKAKEQVAAAMKALKAAKQADEDADREEGVESDD